MTRIRRINVSQVEGRDANNTNDDEIRPFGEAAIYVDDDGQNDKPVLSIHDGVRTYLKSKVLSPGVFYGSNADSGDGANLDTIKLIPDSALYYNNGSYGNDQYIIIDPTEPDHIHIRAGGAIDSSTADLFLGGENTHVRVSDGGGNIRVLATTAVELNYNDGAGWVRLEENNVYIKAGSEDGLTTAEWTFGSDGELYAPGDIKSDTNFVLMNSGNVAGSIKNTGETGIALQVEADIQFEVKVSQTFNPGTEEESTQTALWLFESNGGLKLPSGAGADYYIGESMPGLTITSDNNLAIFTDNTGTVKPFVFTQDGNLTFPEAVFDGENSILPKIQFPIPDIEGDGSIGVGATGFEIKVLDDVWTFSPEFTGEGFVPAKVTFPDGTQQTTAWAGGRVVNTPSFSIGAEDDLIGDIAIDSGYLYYCTVNYTGTATVTWSNVSEFSGDEHYMQADIADPSQLNGNLSITHISVNGASTSTEVVTSFELSTGTTYKFFLANSEPWQSFQASELKVVPNIWRRVAWSNDTW